jgi:glycosyltransferase involved in cell wall biosynthesis/tetratricopeptide (TPR) repeat protein
MKIALAMIVKDTEPVEFLIRCLSTAAPYIDGIFLTLNSKEEKESKDAKKLRKTLDTYAIVHMFPPITFSYTKWEGDFAKARNFNFNQVPAEFEYILWLDADDILRGGQNLRKIAEEALEKDFGAVFFNYLYRVEMDGDKIKNVLIEHLRERLIRNDKRYIWVSPIHETLIPQRDTNQTDSGLCDVVHLSNDERASTAIFRNIDILEKQLESQGKQQDPRTIYYLAKAYFDLRTPENWDKAMVMMKNYLFGSETNTPSGWAEERAQAYEYLAEIYRDRGQFNQALKCILNALQEDPKFPNFYIDMALIYMYSKDWAKAKFWAELSQSIPYPKTTLVTNPKDMQVRVMEVLFNVALNTNDLERAHELSEKILSYFPDSEDVKNRAIAIRAIRDNNVIAHKFIDVARFLNTTGQIDRLQSLVKAIPRQIEEEPIMIGLARDFMPPRRWGDNEIAILCGKGFEKWSPKNIETGIGGSEEAVIYLSNELTKLGWKVTVFADPQDDAGIYDGVSYVPYYKMNPKDGFNILIVWRAVGAFDTVFDTKKTYLWLHDIQNPQEYMPSRLEKIDKIFTLSKWHRDNLPNVPDDMFMVTGNGINLSHFEELDKENIERDPYRMVWTSSYDRGLEHLLKMWPDIKKDAPKANLHIFYGWNLFDTIHRNNPERLAWKTKIEELMKQDGITHHGRVGQIDILREMYKAGVWAYPTHFGEISCITAMKAQAAGAIPVVCAYAALKETVQHGVKINVDESDIYDPDIKREFKNQLVKVLNLGKTQEDIREPMTKWARETFGWSTIADQWNKEFKRDYLKESAETLLKEHPEMEKYLPVQLQRIMGLEETE